MAALLSRIQRLAPKSQFARGVSVLVGGTASAQALLLLAAPLLTRLYSPEDFGILAVFVALLTLCSVAAAGRYELAIPLPEDDADAANLAMVGLLCVLATALLIATTLFFWAGPISQGLGLGHMTSYLWLLPAGVLSIGTYHVGQKWAVRTKAFRKVARTRLEQAVVTIVTQLGGFKLGPVALIIGHALGQAVGGLRLIKSAISTAKRTGFDWKSMVEMAKSYRQFPLYSSWNGLANTASLQVAPIFFTAFFGATVAGFYALTLRVLTIPSSLVGGAIGSVFLSQAPEANRKNELASLVEDIHIKLALSGAVPLFFIMVFGPATFSLIFGEEWRKAGVYAQWMAPWIYLQFQWSPLSMLTIVLQMQGQALVSQLVVLSSRVATVALVYLFTENADHAVLAFALVSAISYLARLAWFTKKAGCNVARMVAIDTMIILSGCFLAVLAIR